MQIENETLVHCFDTARFVFNMNHQSFSGTGVSRSSFPFSQTREYGYFLRAVSIAVVECDEQLI
jgi:hypothetical protein